MSSKKSSPEAIALAKAVLAGEEAQAPTAEATPEARVTNSSKVRGFISALKAKGLPTPEAPKTPMETAMQIVTARAVKELGMSPILAKRYVQENWEKAA